MDLLQVTQDLMRFRTESGNIAEINRCIAYIENMFSGTDARINIFREVEKAPVIFISNSQTQDFDALVLGHIDVVPAEDNMFEPRMEDGKLFGRGSLDMKSFASVALNSMLYVLKNKLDIKFGVMLSTDEEVGGRGTEAFLDAYPKLKAKIVLDNDVGGDILKIINKCKQPVFIKLSAQGKEAHGSCPWNGIDANEKIIQVCANLRKFYPYYSVDGKIPQNKWVDTMHVGKIVGGNVTNIISDYAEAMLDIRLIETSPAKKLFENIEKSLVDGVDYKVVSQGTAVVMDENNEYIKAYKSLAEKSLGKKIEFEQQGGATDSRAFAERGSIVIMHSGSGDGMHASGEYVEFETVEKLAEIQVEFLRNFANKK